MKISDLTKIWPSQPRIVRAGESEMVHIVERNGEKRTTYHVDRRSLANCNRLLKWPRVERGWGQYRLCPTCGGEHPKQTFLDADERGRQWKSDYKAKRDREERLKEAAILAACNWDRLWRDVDKSFLEYIAHMTENDTVLIPINKEDLKWLRLQVNIILRCIEPKDSKNETEVVSMHRAHHLVNDVLISD